MRTRSRTTGSRRPPWRPDGLPQGVPALGYASVANGLALDGPEIEAQRLEIESACAGLGLDLVDLIREHEPEEHDKSRPGLSYALERLDVGEASCLIVSDLERLSRRVPELAAVVDRLERGRVRLIAIDVGLDTATPSGRQAVSPRPGAEAPEEEPEPETIVEQPAALPKPKPEAPPDTYTQAAEGQADAGAERKEGVEGVRALGYASVPSEADGRGLTAQKRAIERSAERLELDLVELVRERESKAGKALDRAGLSYVIQRLAAGDASCLVVSGLERLSRSVAELGTIVQWLELNEVRLVAVELDLDTASPGGQATARALASVADWERERLSERTRKGLAAARAKRRAAGGPATPDWDAIRHRIATMRDDGMTLQAIADALNAEGVPTQRGGAKWRPSSVQTAAGYKRRTTRSKKVSDLPSGGPPSEAGKGKGSGPSQAD